jgi:hypothetical protein
MGISHGVDWRRRKGFGLSDHDCVVLRNDRRSYTLLTNRSARALLTDGCSGALLTDGSAGALLTDRRGETSFGICSAQGRRVRAWNCGPHFRSPNGWRGIRGTKVSDGKGIDLSACIRSDGDTIGDGNLAFLLAADDYLCRGLLNTSHKYTNGRR